MCGRWNVEATHTPVCTHTPCASTTRSPTQPQLLAPSSNLQAHGKGDSIKTQQKILVQVTLQPAEAGGLGPALELSGLRGRPWPAAGVEGGGLKGLCQSVAQGRAPLCGARVLIRGRGAPRCPRACAQHTQTQTHTHTHADICYIFQGWASTCSLPRKGQVPAALSSMSSFQPVSKARKLLLRPRSVPLFVQGPGRGSLGSGGLGEGGIAGRSARGHQGAGAAPGLGVSGPQAPSFPGVHVLCVCV